MTRLVVGPFNRVEGDLEVTLDVEDGVVASARVSTPLYRGFEQILVGRPAGDALVIAPRICGICSVSQSMAAVAALRALGGVEPESNGVLAANLAHAAENIADHLTHFAVFFMPDFTRPVYAGRSWYEAAATRYAAVSGTAAEEFLPARARLLQIMGLVAGKWPHSLAFQPGGTTRTLDLGARMRLRAILRDLRGFFERTVIGTGLDAFLAIATPDALAAYAEAGRGDLPAFLRIAADVGLDRLGPGPGPLASFGAYHGDGGPLFAAGSFDAATGFAPLDPDRIAEDVTHASMRGAGAVHPARGDTVPDVDKADGYSFAKAPRLGGRPAEVGALARQAVDGQPLIRALLARDGGSRVTTRILARMVEIARLLPAMEGWVSSLDPSAPFCADGRLPTDGVGEGLVEAARGALGHWIAVRGGKLSHYQIVAPTTWNFSPRDAAGVPGPLEGALEGTVVGAEGAGSVAVQHVVRSFDPCMVCTAH
ncbi:nickel-dependent hydrogenase large subunit [Oharaeibacter diazotrophicus]|uniref:Hydrogenase large subunit n=3 Tax=Oharaeibacter diazotrophicus TaxID=1920512 RepID=A0A4V3CWJ9_9HYPH|nr:nickel-dependent hydrogenase large subunit [Oharaeibacter diazotrophicus]TDP86658.1 hydrogenase large subunit [Oharaeibacter diazotrophicus]BBE71401.1 periplasmic [NiFeSe] hydrogenase large subunit [Pleomorphomonas sp. SM30]GLS78158.1 HupV protein [Oharaeibacter diazotrophicus]